MWEGGRSKQGEPGGVKRERQGCFAVRCVSAEVVRLQLNPEHRGAYKLTRRWCRWRFRCSKTCSCYRSERGAGRRMGCWQGRQGGQGVWGEGARGWPARIANHTACSTGRQAQVRN